MQDPQLKPEWDIQWAEPYSATTGEKAYLLIEPVIWPDWEEQLQPKAYEPLFSGTRFEDVETGPLLLEIDNQNQEALNAIDAHLTACPAGCLLLTQEEVALHQLAESLRQRIQVVYNKTATLMRFYEPRQLLSLLGSMSTEQRQQFFPHVRRIQWFNHGWLSAAWPPADTTLASPLLWTLTEQQLETITTIAQQWQGAQAR